MNKVSEEATNILIEIIEHENDNQYWEKRFEKLSNRDDTILRGCFKELRENEFISTQWADNYPYIINVLKDGYLYDEYIQLSRNDDMSNFKKNLNRPSKDGINDDDKIHKGERILENDKFKNEEKYNYLITCADDAWESDFYVMDRQRCLTSYTDADVRQEYNLMDELSIKKIMDLPCIFAYEDLCERDSYVGYITKIVVRENGVKFYYKKTGSISYENLHKFAFELDISTLGGITEFTHTHWTIKKVNLYKELEEVIQPISCTENTNKPIVFISYCWTPKENAMRVQKLVEKLQQDGVIVRYDKNSLHPGQDINAFMETLAMDTEIKKVLVICNSDYVRKADFRQGGVGTESEIIIPQIYGHPMQEKIIPIYFERDEHGKFFCPTYLKNRLGIDLTKEHEKEGYKELIEDIRRNNSL